MTDDAGVILLDLIGVMWVGDVRLHVRDRAAPPRWDTKLAADQTLADLSHPAARGHSSAVVRDRTLADLVRAALRRECPATVVLDRLAEVAPEWYELAVGSATPA